MKLLGGGDMSCVFVDCVWHSSVFKHYVIINQEPIHQIEFHSFLYILASTSKPNSLCHRFRQWSGYSY